MDPKMQSLGGKAGGPSQEPKKPTLIVIETDRLRKMRPIVNYYRLIIRQVGTPATEVASSFHGLLQAQEAHPEFAWRLDCFNLKHTIDYKRGPEWEVVPDVDEIQKIFGVSKDDIATKLVLYERGHHFAFWSLQIRTEKVIVRHVNDTDFVAWLGLEKGFSGPIARVKNELPKPGTKKANQPHETTKPATTTDGSASKKLNADHNSDQDPEPPKKKRLTQAELTGHITGLRKGLTDWQLNKTTFYVSVIPTRGLAVPIKLKLCPDVDKFRFFRVGRVGSGRERGRGFGDRSSIRLAWGGVGASGQEGGSGEL